MEATPTGKFVWFDFGIKDETKALPFFKTLFAWDYEPMGPSYWMIKVNGQTVGGLQKVSTGFQPVTGFTPYFNVPSITEAISLLKTAGGKLTGETVTIGDGTMGFFQNFTDLDGNTLSMWSMKK